MTRPPTEEVEVAVLRIVQEALLNVYRHAGADRVDVELIGDADGLHVEVRDDGRGLPAETGRPVRGAGLRSMRERAELLRGHVEVADRDGGGTRVTVRLPVGQPT